MPAGWRSFAATMIPVLTTNPRSGTHYFKSLISAALGISPLERDLTEPSDLLAAVSEANGKQLIYGHFRFSEHGAILDERLRPDLRIVVLTRHPLDRLISQLAFTKAQGGSVPEPEHSPQRLARDLLLGNWDNKPLSYGLIEKDFAATFNSLERDRVTDWLDHRNCHLVRFEELTSRPVEVLAECTEFFGVATPHENLVKITKEINFVTLSGGRSRGQVDPASHYRRGISGEWRAVFSPADLDILRRKYAAAAGKAGYVL